MQVLSWPCRGLLEEIGKNRIPCRIRDDSVFVRLGRGTIWENGRLISSGVNGGLDLSFGYPGLV